MISPLRFYISKKKELQPTKEASFLSIRIGLKCNGDKEILLPKRSVEVFYIVEIS